MGHRKGFDSVGIKVDIIKKDLTNIDMGLIFDVIYDNFHDFTHYLFDCFVGNDDVPVDYLYELNELLSEKCDRTLDNHYRDWAFTVIDKFNDIIDKYCIREGEAAEHEKEMIDLSNVNHDFVPKYSYIITVFYSNGKSFSSQLSRFSNGIVLNLQQNKLELDSPERGSRFYFNLFNLYEPEKIVAIDINLQPVDDLPF